MSTPSNHTKAFVQCYHGKQTVASSRTLLSDHVYAHHSRSRAPDCYSRRNLGPFWAEDKRQFWNGTISGQGHGQSVATVKEWLVDTMHRGETTNCNTYSGPLSELRKRIMQQCSDSARPHSLKTGEAASRHKIWLHSATPATLRPRSRTLRCPPISSPDWWNQRYEVWDWWYDSCGGTWLREQSRAWYRQGIDTLVQ